MVIKKPQRASFCALTHIENDPPFVVGFAASRSFAFRDVSTPKPKSILADLESLFFANFAVADCGSFRIQTQINSTRPKRNQGQNKQF